MSENKAPDLKALVKKAQDGDTVAFGEIYDVLITPIYRYIFYRLNDQDAAEDLTEETFLKVWENLKKYKEGANPFSSWVYRIAHNLVIDHYRKVGPVGEVDENTVDEARHSDPKGETHLKLTQIRLHKLIKQLPEDGQQVIILKFINNLSNEEISAATGKTEGSIRTIQSRALAKLRDYLGHKDDHL